MFLTALIAGLVLLRVFAADQLVDENEPAGRSSVSIAGALNKALSTSSDPEATLDAFVAEFHAFNPPPNPIVCWSAPRRIN